MFVSKGQKFDLMNLYPPSVAAIPVAVEPKRRFAAFRQERAIHHRKLLMLRFDCRLNQPAIQPPKVNLFAKLPSIRFLIQLTVAAQVREVDFATHQHHRRE